MQQHKLLKIMLAAMIILALALPAYALGISPAKMIIDFEPGQKEVTFKVYNDNGRDTKMVVYFRGDLAQKIGVTDSLITVSKDEKFREFTLMLSLPETIGDPGIHTVEVVVMELPEESGSGSSIVTARASVVAELNIRVPYPGKYATANLLVSDAQAGDEVRFSIPVQNYGMQPIFHAKANIEVLGATYERIAYIETNDVSVGIKAQEKLIGIWKADVNPGVYHAKAAVYYDDMKLEIEKDFNVGSAGIEITKIAPEDFKLGDVAIFDIFMKNNWNSIVKGVYGKMTVSGKDGVVYGTYTTETIDLEPYSEEKIKAYWNTRDAKIGTYQLHLAVYYGKSIIEKFQDIQVNIDSISIGPSAEVVGVGAGIVSKESILTMLVFFLIVINVGWFIYFIRKKRK